MRIRTLLAIPALTLALVAPAAHAAKVIYPPISAARADIAAALKQARTEHKNIIVDFGGDWCGDCQVLDIYIHDAVNKPLLDANYVLVHVNVGHIDANQDVAAQYGVPLKKGVPGLAILDARGRVLFSQKNGEFEDMRHMQSSSVTELLNQWKPTK